VRSAGSSFHSLPQKRLELMSLSIVVIPAKAGIHALLKLWIPAFAGMTVWEFVSKFNKAEFKS
ncbi:MAG TPA: hypothetical protein VJC18_06940, partial [bacterium]|nr:hypothetical protein [bacterium]